MTWWKSWVRVPHRPLKYKKNPKKSMVWDFLFIVCSVGQMDVEGGNGMEYENEVNGWFDRIVYSVEPYYNRFIDFITNFYAQYGALGMVVGLVVFALAIVAVVYTFRFVGFLLRLIKKLFLKVTGIEKRRRERADNARLQRRNRGASYKELLEWGKTNDRRAGGNLWEDVVTKAAVEVAAAKELEREYEDKRWEELLSGAVPYAEKLSDIEKGVFSFEDKIHSLIGRVTSIPKNELASETGRLRYGLEVLKSDTDRLKNLQELFPNDVNISSLVELCEAFILSTKNIEKGFLAALES